MDSGLPRSGPLEEDCRLQNEDTSGPCGRVVAAKIGGCKSDRPPSSIGLKLSLWVVRRMYKVDVYLRVRRAVMVEGMSIREAARVFGLHRDSVRNMLAL